MWQQWVNAVLGLGVIAVPFIDLATTTATWTLSILGLAIALFGFWGATEHVAMDHHKMTHA